MNACIRLERHAVESDAFPPSRPFIRPVELLPLRARGDSRF